MEKLNNYYITSQPCAKLRNEEGATAIERVFMKKNHKE